MMVPLRLGSKRAAVTLLQRGYNERARKRPGWERIEVDGELGPQTFEAVVNACYWLGALGVTLTTAKATKTVTVGMQRLVRFPDDRSGAQFSRAKARASKTALAAGPEAALVWARQWIGKTEQPPESNMAPWGLTDWQRALGAWLVGQAWCGTFVGTALKHAGVAITSRVAGVSLILDDALNGRNGFDRVIFRRRTNSGSVGAGKPGDAVGLFGESTHVELVEKRVPGGYQTIGGNTSSGSSGSQSNGGGCFRRFRPDSAVVYIARPDWS
jgi:hypothetical protein